MIIPGSIHYIDEMDQFIVRIWPLLYGCNEVQRDDFTRIVLGQSAKVAFLDGVSTAEYDSTVHQLNRILGDKGLLCPAGSRMRGCKTHRFIDLVVKKWTDDSGRDRLILMSNLLKQHFHVYGE